MSKKNLPIAFVSRSAPFVAQKIAELYGMHFFGWKRIFQHMDKKAIKKPMNLFIIGLYCKGSFEHVFMQYAYLSSYFNKIDKYYAKNNNLIHFKERLDQVHSFTNKNILQFSQGPKGKWD